MRQVFCNFTSVEFFLCLFIAAPSFAEDVTITTYYPSPYGIYKHLSVDDGADSTATSYGSLQIVREENSHYGSHLAFIRNKGAFTPAVMGLGYKRSSDTFGFGPGVNTTTGFFDPTTLSINSSGNVGIGISTPTETASPTGGSTNGNLDVNDVYLRSAARWASSLGGGFSPPRTTGTYVGNGNTFTGERVILMTSGTPSAEFQPRRVVIWVDKGATGEKMSETFEGMVVGSGKTADYSLHCTDNKIEFTRTFLKIVAGDNGFRVKGDNNAYESNNNKTYFWMAWD